MLATLVASSCSLSSWKEAVLLMLVCGAVCQPATGASVGVGLLTETSPEPWVQDQGAAPTITAGGDGIDGLPPLLAAQVPPTRSPTCLWTSAGSSGPRSAPHPADVATTPARSGRTALSSGGDGGSGAPPMASLAPSSATPTDPATHALGGPGRGRAHPPFVDPTMAFGGVDGGVHLDRRPVPTRLRVTSLSGLPAASRLPIVIRVDGVTLALATIPLDAPTILPLPPATDLPLTLDIPARARPRRPHPTRSARPHRAPVGGLRAAARHRPPHHRSPPRLGHPTHMERGATRRAGAPVHWAPLPGARAASRTRVARPAREPDRSPR